MTGIVMMLVGFMSVNSMKYLRSMWGSMNLVFVIL